MIRTNKTGSRITVEYEGRTTDIIADYAAILKGLLADDELKNVILLTTLNIIDNEYEKDQI